MYSIFYDFVFYYPGGDKEYLSAHSWKTIIILQFQLLLIIACKCR